MTLLSADVNNIQKRLIIVLDITKLTCCKIMDSYRVRDGVG